MVQEDVPVDLWHREDGRRPSDDGRRDAGSGGEADEHPRGDMHAPPAQRQRRSPSHPRHLRLGLLRLILSLHHFLEASPSS